MTVLPPQKAFPCAGMCVPVRTLCIVPGHCLPLKAHAACISQPCTCCSSCSLCSPHQLHNGSVAPTCLLLGCLPARDCSHAASSVGRGGAEAAAAAAAERAADSAEADLLSNLPEKLDEFGRDENVELREEMSRRAHKRATQYSHSPAQPQVCCCCCC